MSARTPLPPLLGAQLVFNTGFYAVVPFLAVVLRDDFALGGAAVGAVLGLRTFAQQGMFLVGGLLVDLLGARTLIVVGCVVRTLGFALLAVPGQLWLFVVGVVLTGLGGAMFSPALESLVAYADRARTGRTTAFALLSVCGETGAVLGPLLGALLLGWGFTAVAGGGAVIFAVTAVTLAAVLAEVPQARRPAAAEPGARRLPTRPLPTRRLAVLAAVCSVNLLAYNQLYLGLPYELDRAGLDASSGGVGALATLFAMASLLTVALQLPVARLCRRIGTPLAIRVGYLVMSLGFGVLAVAAPLPPPDLAWLPVTVAVALLVLGHLVVTPTTLEAVGRLAPAGATGASYGLMATAGGVAVLVGNVGLGLLYPAAATPGPSAGAVWLVLVALPLVPALVAPRVLRRAPAPTPHLQEPR